MKGIIWKGLGIGLVIVLQVTLATAQFGLSDFNLNRADKAFVQNDFQKAIDLYRKALKSHPDNYQLHQNLAHCYRLTHQYELAERAYQKALKFPDPDPALYLYYGQVLKNNEKLKQAKDVFLVYSTNHPNDKRSEQQLMALDKVITWGNKYSMFRVHAATGLNTDHAEFAPVPYKGDIVFTSDRAMSHVTTDTYGSKGTPQMTVYETTPRGDTSFTEPKLFSFYINDGHHNGPITFNDSGDYAIFTRVVDLKLGPNHINRPQLFISTLDGDTWTDAVKFEHNSAKHSMAHPALSPDGKTLIFVSDMEGGYGGKDLYKSVRNSDGSWSVPENLGSIINSPEDELFPYLHPDGTLYFASNGHAGYGGLDIFSAQKRGDSWGFIENLKAPLNSHQDDFGISFFDNSTGYFSSNRKKGAGKDDIYAFTKLDRAPNEVTTSITGLFMYESLKPVTGEKLLILDEDDNVIMTTVTREDGSFEITDLAPNIRYNIALENKTLASLGVNAFITNEEGDIVEQLHTSSPGVFAFRALPYEEYSDMPELKPAADVSLSSMTIMGQLYDKLPGDVPPGLEIIVVNDQGEIIMSTKTDKNGNFFLKNLPPDQELSIQLKESYPDAKMYLVDAEGNPVSEIVQNEAGDFDYRTLNPEHYREMGVLLAEDPVPEEFMLTGQLYKDKPGDMAEGEKVLLVDENGNILQETSTDQFGNFNFTKLPSDQTFFLRLANAKDDVNLVVYDDDEGLAMEPNTSGDFEYNYLKRDVVKLNRLAANDDSGLSYRDLRGQLYQTLPGDVPEGMEVYLVDDDGNIVMVTKTDKNGNFDFKSLPPDQTYHIRIQEGVTDMSMLVYDEDDHGYLVEPDNGDFEYNYLKRQETALSLLKANDTKPDMITSFEGQFYKETPGDIDTPMELELVNEDGEVYATMLTDAKGNFDFQNLPPDQVFFVRLKQAQDDINMVLLDEQGVKQEVPRKNGQFDYNYLAYQQAGMNRMNATDAGSMIPQKLSGQLYQKIPGDLSGREKVALVNEKGEIVMTATTDRFGNFEFTQLPPNQTFYLKPLNTKDDLSMIVMDETGAARKTERGKSGNFEYELLPADASETLVLQQSSDTEALFATGIYGQVYQHKPGDTGEGIIVELVDPASRSTIKSAVTDSRGSFFMDQMEHQGLELRIANADNKSLTMMILDDEGNFVNVIEPNEAGNFDYTLLTHEYVGGLSLFESADDAATMLDQGLYGQVYHDRPGDLVEETTVQLKSKTGEVIRETNTTDHGHFGFSEAPEVEFTVAIPNQKQPVKIMVQTSSGDMVQTLKPDASGDFDYQLLKADLIKGLKIKESSDEVLDLLAKGIYGQIYTATIGDGPKGISLQLIDKKGNEIARTQTAKYGAFHFPTVSPESSFILSVLDDPTDYNVAVMDEQGNIIKSYARGDKGDFDYKILSYDLAEGISRSDAQDAEMLAFPIGQSISGRVYGLRHGDGPEGLTVEAFDDQGSLISATKTGAFGEFNFTELPSDVVFLFRLKEVNDASGFKLFVTPDDETTGKTLYQAADGSFNLKKPVSETTYSQSFQGVFFQASPGDLDESLTVELLNKNHEVVATTVTKPDGSFEFTNLHPDNVYFLRAQNATDTRLLIVDEEGEMVETPQRSSSNEFALKETRNHILTHLYLNSYESDAQKEEIRAQLVDENNNPIPNRVIYLHNSRNELITVLRSDENGYFHFYSLASETSGLTLKEAIDGAQFIINPDHGAHSSTVQITNNRAIISIAEALAAEQPTQESTDNPDKEMQTDQQIDKQNDHTSQPEPPESSKGKTAETSDTTKALQPFKAVNFGFDDVSPTRSDLEILDRVVTDMTSKPEWYLLIVGHTDNLGPESYNQILSLKRAEAVATYLENRGVPKSRIRTEGKGEAHPVAPNQNPDGSDNKTGRLQNRRAEFFIGVRMFPTYHQH